ncbi:hypothetical protein WA158_008401 [Blastocystis sp. Blastoise]
MQAIEFFAGIGGLHTALKLVQPEAKVTVAYDINPKASEAYLHNYPETEYIQKDIKGIRVKTLEKLHADIWLLSPPCQPHTRNGLQKGADDARSCGFLHIIDLLKEIEYKPKYILLENVEGFEVSESHRLFVEALSLCHYYYQEYILSPNQFQVPNQRDRFFIIARTTPFSPVPNDICIINHIMRQIPKDQDCTSIVYINGTAEMGTKESEELWKHLNSKCKYVDDYLEFKEECPEDSPYSVHTSVLTKSGSALDIVSPLSQHTCCFTKSYRQYNLGTGSLLQTLSPPLPSPIPRDIQTLKLLHLRYFTSTEMKRLHGYPDTYTFPETLTETQKCRLVGNSLSVTVVSHLLKHLFKVEENSN